MYLRKQYQRHIWRKKHLLFGFFFDSNIFFVFASFGVIADDDERKFYGSRWLRRF